MKQNYMTRMVAAALLAICLFTILLLIFARSRAKKAIPADKEELSPEEEDAFLRVTSSAIHKAEPEAGETSEETAPEETDADSDQAGSETAEAQTEEGAAEAGPETESESVTPAESEETPKRKDIDIPL